MAPCLSGMSPGLSGMTPCLSGMHPWAFRCQAPGVPPVGPGAWLTLWTGSLGNNSGLCGFTAGFRGHTARGAKFTALLFWNFVRLVVDVA